MTNNDFFTLFLYPDEHIEWSTSSVWARAAKPWRQILRIIRKTFVVTFIALSCAIVQNIDVNLQGDSWYILIGQILISALAPILFFLTPVAWILVAMDIVSFFDTRPQRSEATYLLTNRRLILVTGQPESIVSISSANYLIKANLFRNGSVYDLVLWFGPLECGDDSYYDYESPVCLQAVEPGVEAKKQIIKRFGQAKFS